MFQKIYRTIVAYASLSFMETFIILFLRTKFVMVIVKPDYKPHLPAIELLIKSTDVLRPAILFEIVLRVSGYWIDLHGRLIVIRKL